MLIATIGLAACESDEEKAERHYQSGLALLQAGDTDRAFIELRNVFEHNGFHREAREVYAAALMNKGEVGQAISQYLRLVELYPDAIDARVILAETAILSADWDEAMRHADAAQELAPDAPGVEAVNLALKYRSSVLDSEEAERAAAAARARGLLDDGAENLLLTLIAVDFLLESERPRDALPYIDTALTRDRDQYDLHLRKLRLFSDQGDAERTGDQLRVMSEVFPDSIEVRQQLIAWYINQSDLTGAEDFLRALAEAEEAGTAERINLVHFMLSLRGPEAAVAELDALVTQSDEAEARNLYTRLYASIDYERGQIEDAVARLQGALNDENVSPTDKVETQVLLARIHDNQGALETAQSLVAEVLEADPGNTDALQMRANWLIKDGDIRSAIINLRAALNENPRDPQTLALMALAHERDGDMDLAAERLALAVEVSGEAPAQSLRYAAFLMDRGRPGVAGTVLRAAARKNPRSTGVLNALANLYLGEQDWARAQDIADQLRSLDDPDARRDAQFLQAAILSGQNRIEESLSFLQNQIASGTDGSGTYGQTVLIVQNLIRSGKLDSALSFVTEQTAEKPDSLELQLLQANLFALSGDLSAAEDGYRAVMDAAPQAPLPVRLLLTLLFASDRNAEARTVLDTGLQRIPNSMDLNWIKASLLEKEGDLAGAIEIYQTLYRLDGSNIVVANNLASLMVAVSNDSDMVERAFGIARRLRDKPVPQFQDTYGWLLHLRGESAEGLAHLQKAIAELPDHPQVNYHLGVTYAALGRNEDARHHLTRAVELSDEASSQIAMDARTKLERLD